MCADQISTEKMRQCVRSSEIHNDHRFLLCHSMGEITFHNITITLGLEDTVTFYPQGDSG